MATGTKIKMLPTLVVLVVLAAVGYVMVPKLLPGQDEPENTVLVMVTFKPEQRSGKPDVGRQFPDVVSVELTVGGRFYPKERVTSSPWVRSVYPNKKTSIEVKASQVYGDMLSCAIMQHGKEVGGPDIRYKSTTVICQATVI